MHCSFYMVHEVAVLYLFTGVTLPQLSYLQNSFLCVLLCLLPFLE